MPGFVDPVLFLVDRIADVHPAPAYFAGFELEEWDDGAEGILVSQGVFIETTHARSARCGGCEFQCNFWERISRFGTTKNYIFNLIKLLSWQK